jgi:pre-rRNA-processing protein TSR3
MQSFPFKNFPVTIVLRHRRENLNKCSLRGLEKRQDFKFFSYPNQEIPILANYILLTLDAPELSLKDQEKGLLILDGTWRYAEKMYKHVIAKQNFTERSIPKSWKTAYPRRQDDCPDPNQGLASIEAIYAAYSILNRDTQGLLDFYHWKELFLDKNLG